MRRHWQTLLTMSSPVRAGLENLWTGFSLAHQFMAASLIVLAFCMSGVGWWVSQQIETRVIHETADASALYMNSVVAPLVQELAEKDYLHPESIANLDRLLHQTPLGRRVVSIKIWKPDGRIVYSSNSALIGETFPVTPILARASQGRVAFGISNLDGPQHAKEREGHERLLEIYIPVHRRNDPEIIAVAEFYQPVDELGAQLTSAQSSTWLFVGGTTLAIYLLLAGIVRRGSNIIQRQQSELRGKVDQLTDLLGQNARLADRVQRAATQATARNERFLRRTSAELHDGPAQAVSAALLRLDSLFAEIVKDFGNVAGLPQAKAELAAVQGALQDALSEIRAISGGLALPELENASLRETLERVCRRHQQRTDTEVRLDLEDAPESSSLPLKITIYRLVQEALTNSYRHAGGRGQKVSVSHNGIELNVEISDLGQGIDWEHVRNGSGKLGLEGMRQRVESIGGTFLIESKPGFGTRVVASVPLDLGST